MARLDGRLVQASVEIRIPRLLNADSSPPGPVSTPIGSRQNVGGLAAWDASATGRRATNISRAASLSRNCPASGTPP